MGEAWTTCPGCGLQMPPNAWLPKSEAASTECWELYGEVTGHELADPALVRDLHQLTVDAYQAQHPGERRGLIYALVGLHMALDLQIRGVDIRTAHSRMGSTEPHWPRCTPPPRRGALTVADVALATSPEEHARLVHQWARQVWEAWWSWHDGIVDLTRDHVLPLVPEARRANGQPL